ncbi:MAG: four helix bundle protein [Magnetococcus sp. WYHC-3]
MNLEELEVYQTTMAIGERVWKNVNAWDYFAKDTVGKQFVKAADSMAANISEGFGRFFYKENKQFGYYARGSLYETKTWLAKAHNRRLVEEEEYKLLRSSLDSIAVRLNNYIRSIGAGATAVRETTEEYDAHEIGESLAGEARVNGGCAATLNDAPQAQMTTNDAAQRPMTRRSRK